MKKENRIFVVNWAEYEGNEKVMTSGQFIDIYSTFEKAHAAVMQVIRDGVKDEIDSCCDNEDEVEATFGTKDFDEIVKKFIVRDGKSFVIVYNPNTDVETHYGITCYDVNQVV